MFPIKAFAPHVTSELRFLCDPVTWERYERCKLVVGDQVADDALYKANPSSVTTNQRPLNGSRWGLSGRPITEKSHVGVFTDGENIRSTSYQDRANLVGNSCAVGIATHLAMTGRASPGPFIVLLWLEKKHNWLIDADTQLMGAASRLVLVAGHRQR